MTNKFYYIWKFKNYQLISIFILGSIFLFSCSGGNKIISDRQVNSLKDSAFSNYRNSNFESAYGYYNLLLKTKSETRNDIFYAAQTAAFSGHYKRSVELIDLMLKKYKNQDAGKLVQLIIDSNWNYYSSLKKEKKFKKVNDLLETQKADTSFLDLSRLVNNLFIKDQNARKQYQKDPSSENEFLLQKSDSINHILVDSILNQYGFLSYKKIGYKANSALAILYQHLDEKSFMDNFYLIQKAHKEEAILSPDYALILDRYLVRSDKKQEYGTQCYYDSLKKSFLFKPIRDLKNIEKRRWEMGLDSLTTYARNNKILIEEEK